MRISDERLIEIEELAEAVSRTQKTFPINLEKIARENDLKFKYKDDPRDWDGYLVYQHNTFFIFINLRWEKSINGGRTRFTFAHEIGHYFIDEHRNSMLQNKSIHSSKSNFNTVHPIEQEANHFASNLLMPKDEFYNIINKREFSIDLIKELTVFFQTSLFATFYRYFKLKIYPLFIIPVTDGIIGKIKHPKDWNYGYDKMEGHKVPFGSIYHELIKGEEIDEVDINYELWFSYKKDFDNDGDEGESVLIEYCIQTGQNSYWIIIWESYD